MDRSALSSNEAVLSQLQAFFAHQSPTRLVGHLRRMLLHYLRSNDKANKVEDSNVLLGDMDALFDLLETVGTNVGVGTNRLEPSVHPNDSLHRELADEKPPAGSYDTIMNVDERKGSTEGELPGGPDSDDEEEEESDIPEWLLIQDFFYAFGADDYGEVFWDMLKRALTNEADETSAADRDLMLSFYEHLKDLISAAHDLWTARKQERLQKKESSIPQI